MAELDYNKLREMVSRCQWTFAKGKYFNPYLYIDDYKYWTMGAPVEETIIMNRAKVKQS